MFPEHESVPAPVTSNGESAGNKDPGLLVAHGSGGRMVDLFHQYFELIPATSDELKREVYKLRYQVYCQETGFESVENCQVGRNALGELEYYEIDEFDARSEYYLIRHRASRLFAATTRLVLPDLTNPDAAYPIEKYCSPIAKITDSQQRLKLGEISRYAVSRNFKRRAGEAGTLAGVSDQAELAIREGERRALPLLSMALWACMMRMAHRHGVKFLYGAMEPALFRLFHRNGIHFKEIGPGMEYHGIRLPCVINLDEMVMDLQRENFNNWELITNCGEFV
jgi:N-acyl amino acid synthase of PEP-CTERM/exosortase system